MTDIEIKKNLEDLLKLMLHEGDLQRTSIASKALDLIKRKDVEIERLNIELQSMRSAANSYKMHYETAKSEAVKDFVEKFKRKATVVHKTHSGKHWYEIDDDEIDNILKEMTEVEK